LSMLKPIFSETLTLGDTTNIEQNEIILITDNKTRVTATTNIRNLLSGISNEVKNGTCPVIKYNKLIDHFNTLLKLIDPNYKNIPLLSNDMSMYAILSLDQPLGDIPVRLKHGDKILIPMNDTNYSRFTKEQLEEMLVILDVYTTGDHRFDQVRTNIAREISNKNN
ncbi:MAG TPA: hypothetical protein VKR58_04215, partial [Aquella sp.]|nr:hypothetical protein [Aquella sp.]